MISKRSLIIGSGALFLGARRARAWYPTVPLPAMPALSNPYAFPSSRPGVNLNHIALARVGGPNAIKFSGVASSSGGTFFRLDAAGQGTISGSPASKMTTFGPTLANSSSTSAVVFTIGSASAGTGNGMTLACIFAPTTTQSTNAYLVSGDNHGEQGIGIATGSIGNLGYWQGGNGFTGLPVSFNSTPANVPHLFIVSLSAAGTGLKAIRLNMVTGVVITTASGAGFTLAEPATVDTVGIANWPAGPGLNQGVNANIAAAAVLRVPIGISDMLQWAQRPWDFWYPPIEQNMALSVGTGGTATSTKRLRTLLGVGQ